MLVFLWLWSRCQCFYHDVLTDECLSVTQKDLLTDSYVIEFLDLVDAVDHKEVASFVLDLCSNSTNIVDSVWVRRWVEVV